MYIYVYIYISFYIYIYISIYIHIYTYTTLPFSQNPGSAPDNTFIIKGQILDVLFDFDKLIDI